MTEIGSLRRALADAALAVEAAYPYEGCGWLLYDRHGWRARPVRNRLIDIAPARARRRFEMAPGELIEVLSAVDRADTRLVAVYHSHPDAPALPSAADLRAWAPSGTPLYPGVTMLIGEVGAGRWQRWRAHRWFDSRLAEVAIEVGLAVPEDIRAPAGYHRE